MGKTLNKSNNLGKLKEYITTSNLYWDQFDLTELRTMKIKEEELDRYTAFEDDLLICEGGDAGRSAIWKSSKPICFQNHIHRVRPFVEIRTCYLYYFMLHIYLNGDIKQYLKGVGIQSLSGNALASIVLPLPPLYEQQRIVDELKRLFELIDDIDENGYSLEQFITRTKSKVLDLAIRGKLVPQDPQDEPASELLKRINPKAKITSDTSHYPFEIPNSWIWANGITCFNPMENKKPDGKYFNYIDIEAIDNKRHTIKGSKKLRVSEAPSRAIRLINKDDTLFSMVRPYLENIAFVDSQYDKCIASTGFYVCKPNKLLFPKYLFFLMLSNYVINGLNSFMKGDNSPSINNANITTFLYPIPPLAEQQRIVKKIEQIFTELDKIQETLQTTS